MIFEDWLALAAILVCLLLSFFFAGSETALTASSRATMSRLAQQGNRQAGTVTRLLAARERLIGNIVASMKSVPQRIQEVQVRHFYKADPAYGTDVAKGLGLNIEKIIASEGKVAAAD